MSSVCFHLVIEVCELKVWESLHYLKKKKFFFRKRIGRHENPTISEILVYFSHSIFVPLKYTYTYLPWKNILQPSTVISFVVLGSVVCTFVWWPLQGKGCLTYLCICSSHQWPAIKERLHSRLSLNGTFLFISHWTVVISTMRLYLSWTL